MKILFLFKLLSVTSLMGGSIAILASQPQRETAPRTFSNTTSLSMLVFESAETVHALEFRLLDFSIEDLEAPYLAEYFEPDPAPFPVLPEDITKSIVSTNVQFSQQGEDVLVSFESAVLAPGSYYLALPYTSGESREFSFFQEDLTVEDGIKIDVFLGYHPAFGVFQNGTAVMPAVIIKGFKEPVVPEVDVTVSNGELLLEFSGVLQRSSSLESWESIHPQPSSPFSITESSRSFYRAISARHSE